MTLGATTWITPAGEVERGNLLGAANAAVGRMGREVTIVVEGAEREEDALTGARETGLLVVPESGRALPSPPDELALLRRARDEGWRLLLLSLGADSAAKSGDLAEGLLERLIATTVPAQSPPLPPPALRRRVSVGNEAMFLRSGLMHAECFEACLAQANASLSDGELLDWGAGCGRMTVHWASKAPNLRVTAVDTDAEAIEWIAGNLGVGDARALPLLPPTDLAADSFDLVVGHSVFSHLEVEAQDLWLGELARLARPGAHLAVSFNGPVALRWHLEHPLVEVPGSVAADVEREGIAVWREDGWEDEFYEGYHTTFHSHDYVREHWSQWLDVVAIHEAAALPIQDIAVLRSR